MDILQPISVALLDIERPNGQETSGTGVSESPTPSTPMQRSRIWLPFRMRRISQNVDRGTSGSSPPSATSIPPLSTAPSPVSLSYAHEASLETQESTQLVARVSVIIAMPTRSDSEIRVPRSSQSPSATVPSVVTPTRTSFYSQAVEPSEKLPVIEFGITEVPVKTFESLVT